MRRIPNRERFRGQERRFMVSCANAKGLEDAMSNAELECFKTEINLTEYAAVQGYVLARHESSRNCASMKHPNGDKIIVAKGEDQHWIYFSVRDDRDNGSIIDFIQNRQQCSLGQVRQLLRGWFDGNRPILNPKAYIPHLETSSKDRQKVLLSYERMQEVTEHPYLETRAVGKECLSDRRFLGRVRIDDHNNAVFPHYDERLVITESAIDALSFHILEGNETTQYVSTAGEWNPNTPSLLRHAVETLPGNIVVLAFDNDKSGKEYEARSRDLFQDFPQKVVTLFPTAKDWNDVLRGFPFPDLFYQKMK